MQENKNTIPACKDMASLLEQYKSSAEALDVVLARALKGYLVYNRRPAFAKETTTASSTNSNAAAPNGTTSAATALSPTGTTSIATTEEDAINGQTGQTATGNIQVPEGAANDAAAYAKKPLSATPGKKPVSDAPKKAKRKLLPFHLFFYN